MPTHKYYAEDTEQRKNYFDNQFLSNAKSYAQSQGISLNDLLSRIHSFTGFKETLEIVWSQDSSLLAYFKGMDNEELREFFDRQVIQRIIEDKITKEEKVPDLVFQENKKTRKFFLGQVTNRKTGKKEKVFVKPISFKIRGKSVTRYRDSKGRFANLLK